MTSAGCASVGNPGQSAQSTAAEAVHDPLAQVKRTEVEKTPEPLVQAPRVQVVDTGMEASQTQVGRYTVTDAQPPKELANPLAVIATISFPRAQVQTVGEALAYLLLRTGYGLDQAKLNETARHVLTLPLPESHRRLGPYRVDDIVRTLIGQAWTLRVDGMVRSVAFDVQQPSENTKAITAAR